MDSECRLRGGPCEPFGSGGRRLLLRRQPRGERSFCGRRRWRTRTDPRSVIAAGEVPPDRTTPSRQLIAPGMDSFGLPFIGNLAGPPASRGLAAVQADL